MVSGGGHWQSLSQRRTGSGRGLNVTGVAGAEDTAGRDRTAERPGVAFTPPPPHLAPQSVGLRFVQPNLESV